MTNPARVQRNSLLAVVFMVIAAANAAAFTFTPMSTTISPSGANAVVTYRVTNDSAAQTAVAIKVMTRVIDSKGNETNEPADKAFLVFPSRIVLPANSSQNVKVQYKGSSTLPNEIAYRVFAEQLPVDFTKATSSGVNILLRYVAALYVAPKATEPKLVVTSAIAGSKDGKAGLIVTLTNSGTRHALLSEPKLELAAKGGLDQISFTGASLSEIDGQNLLAKSVRTFFVPWDTVPSDGTFEGSFHAEIE